MQLFTILLRNSTKNACVGWFGDHEKQNFRIDQLAHRLACVLLPRPMFDNVLLLNAVGCGARVAEPLAAFEPSPWRTMQHVRMNQYVHVDDISLAAKGMDLLQSLALQCVGHNQSHCRRSGLDLVTRIEQCTIHVPEHPLLWRQSLTAQTDAQQFKLMRAMFALLLCPLHQATADTAHEGG